MRILVLIFLALASLPIAVAQNESTDELPVGTGPPGPEESIEGGWGISYGSFVMIGTIVVVVALAYVSYKQRRNPPPEP